MALAETSRILRVGSNKTRRFRSCLDLSTNAKPSPLSFHRAHLSLRYQENHNEKL
jgi:hypothetical protein